MKATGIVRRLDQLGRIVIPKEMRNVFDIQINDPIEIFVEDDTIVLKKYQPACIFCGKNENVVEFDDKNVCKACIEKLKKL